MQYYCTGHLFMPKVQRCIYICILMEGLEGWRFKVALYICVYVYYFKNIKYSTLVALCLVEMLIS